MNSVFRRATRYLWREWIRPFALVAAFVFPLKSAVADWNWVPSGSMRPTILEGELIFINKLAYDLKVPFTTRHVAAWGNPQRGDIAVFYSPEDGTRLVKRVIGVPGDRIALHNGRLTLNGQPLALRSVEDTWREYATALELSHAIVRREQLGAAAHASMLLPPLAAIRDFNELVVPAGQYFMMGDNRDQSYDSRFFGFVPREQILGEANAVVLSFDPESHLLPRLRRCLTTLL